MKIEHNGQYFVVRLDRVVGTVHAQNAAELMATVEHYYRPAGYRRGHVEGRCRSCPLCAQMREQERHRRRDQRPIRMVRGTDLTLGELRRFNRAGGAS